MDEEYLEAVLDLVAAIPAGRVMTYGSIAEVVGERLGRGGPRQVGQVMARAGSGVPWWRVVDASGRPPRRHTTRAVTALAADGCPLTPAAPDGTRRVRLRAALWWPDEEPGAAPDADAGAGPDLSPARAGS